MSEAGTQSEDSLTPIQGVYGNSSTWFATIGGVARAHGRRISVKRR